MRLHIEAANIHGTDFKVIDSDTGVIYKNDTLQYCKEFVEYYHNTGRFIGCTLKETQQFE